MTPTTDTPIQAFVLSLPPEMPAKEVVARGKTAGVPLAENTVYRVRRERGHLPPHRASSHRKLGGGEPMKPIALKRATPTFGEVLDALEVLVAAGLDGAHAWAMVEQARTKGLAS
jgi:hypothetical protein